MTVGEHPDLLTIQLDLLARLGDRTSQPRTVSEARERLRRVAAERRVLIVVDDVWSDAAALAFRITGPSGRLIYTSRDEQVITAAGATAHRIEVIEVLSREVARGLAAGILNIEVDALPATAARSFQDR